MASRIQLSLFAPPLPSVTPGEAKAKDYSDPFLAYHKEALDAADSDRLTFDNATWNRAETSAVGVDVESYRNFFLVCFTRFSDSKRLAFEASNRSELNLKAIKWLLKKNQIITFNGNCYDLPMLLAALQGSNPQELKRLSDRLISGEGQRWWQAEQDFDRFGIKLDHIDLIDTNPSVRQGLKMLGGRLHTRFMVDLPYDPDAVLTPRQMNVVTLYCFNDIAMLGDLFAALREPLELRIALGELYGLQLRSRSDAQVGEAIVKKRVEIATGRRLGRAEPPKGSFFLYEPPAFLSFQDERLSGLVDKLKTTSFTLSGLGKPEMPELLKKFSYTRGMTTYKFGIGGIHSQEAHRALRADDEWAIEDVDVASQYPNIIVKLGLYPPAIGPIFLDVYGESITQRLAAKDRLLRDATVSEAECQTLKVLVDGYRIQLNGVYGKLGSPGLLHAPNLLIAVTVTGQLSILMLADMAERRGLPVVSANTDGLVFRYRRAHRSILNEVLAEWESATGFQTERTPYEEIYNSSVNTYIALKPGGKAKVKGPIADPWTEGDLRGQMMKNPQMTVLTQAVLALLTKGVPLGETIQTTNDPRAFVTVVKVAAGARWRNHYLGRAVRYYWALDGDPIMTADGARRIGKTEGARPIQELEDRVPSDLDRLRYYEESVRLAHDLGVSEGQIR
jgi:hypothetical protein